MVFGSTGGFAASLDLSALDGSNGFVLNGIDASDNSGISVSGAGDVNGDGIDDLIIGASGSDRIGGANFGESYVVFGSTGGFSASLDLSALDGSNGFVLNGIDADDLTGFSVASAGDVNGDGVDDLIIGARGGDPSANLGDFNDGESYVVFGSTAGFAASLDLSALDGSNGFVLNGIDGGDLSGYSVAGAGDVNGDGFDDLIIGAVNADPNGQIDAGESYVVFGRGSFTPVVDAATVTVTINGVNDPAVIGGDTTGMVIEDDLANLQASGVLTVTDPDDGEDAFQPAVVALTYGQATIDAAGNWLYGLQTGGANVQALAEGQTVTDSVTFTTVDGTTQDVTISVQGANDAPSLDPIGLECHDHRRRRLGHP